MSARCPACGLIQVHVYGCPIETRYDMQAKSDTPRTDKAMAAIKSFFDPYRKVDTTLRDLAKQLERELAAAKSSVPEGGTITEEFRRAVYLIEICRSCDVHYDGPWGNLGPSVAQMVDAFLTKNKAAIKDYSPANPEDFMSHYHARPEPQDAMTDKKKTCRDCVYYWRDGSGYSDWTWMETTMRCFLNAHPDLPADEPYEETKAPQLSYAEKCEHFEDASYDGDPALVSPDGNLNEGGNRAAALIRKASK